ncbi:transaldolase family protein [Tumidithrix elongata RA019]|uniref:Transaldolase n=1 Tax=Tumidithrix elongata BACA0141 TaxID=2716417 RepID=A0AAW9Q2D0_9CYAN|nr:transaldolase family protein [Tumidithrix elongata RA019]
MNGVNLLKSLRQQGQSVWLDGFERSLILTGQLQRSIDLGLRGLLSNFTCLEQPIRAGSYDRDFRAIVHQPDINARSLYEYLIIQDMQLAADLIKAVHSQTHASDGFVNLDLPPQVAFDTQATLTEAHRLWQSVGWSNLMLKIPATAATLPAIVQLIQDGINVNVTLLFSQVVYEQVAEAYLRGLEILSMQGKSVSEVASVASFSVGHLDAEIATQLQTAGQERVLRELFLGNVAIAQAKVMYQHYQSIYQSDRWQSLAHLGAQPQRLLWDITSIENDHFRTQHYIQSLMGESTVLALTPQIFQEQKLYSPSEADLTVGVDVAHQMLNNLEQLISLETLADRLLTEELQRSQDAYQQLLSAIEQKRQSF